MAANDVLRVRRRVVRKTGWWKSSAPAKNRNVEFGDRSRLGLNLVESRSGLEEKHSAERTRGITPKDGQL